MDRRFIIARDLMYLANNESKSLWAYLCNLAIHVLDKICFGQGVCRSENMYLINYSLLVIIFVQYNLLV